MEYQNSTTEKNIAGWERYDTVEDDGGYGAWCAWSAEKPENRKGRGGSVDVKVIRNDNFTWPCYMCHCGKFL